MGEVEKMGFELKSATVDDIHDLARVQMEAMSWDPLLWEMKKGMTEEELYAFGKTLLVGRMTVGEELGACKTFKVVDEKG
jgi:hypothetical protein